MDSKNRLTEAFRRLGERPSPLQPARVQAVDEEKRTCSLTLVASEAKIAAARLQAVADGSSEAYFFVIPKPESSVLVAQMGEEWVVLLSSEVAKIALRGDSLGGLIKIQALTEKINAAISELNTNIESVRGDLDAFVKKFNMHTHTGATFSGTIAGSPASGTLTVPKTTGNATAPAALTAAADLNKEDYENEEVTHA